jgi:hypothetical protein
MRSIHLPRTCPTYRRLARSIPLLSYIEYPLLSESALFPFLCIFRP